MINYALHTRLKGANRADRRFPCRPGPRAGPQPLQIHLGAQRHAAPGDRPCRDDARSRGSGSAHTAAPHRGTRGRGRLPDAAVQQQFLLHLRPRRRSILQRAAFQRRPGNGTAAADAARTAALYEIADKLAGEYAIEDSLREEMLRILLKRFIITCTRLARERFAVAPGKEKAFDIVRQYYVLVDEHFREKKQVQEYADLLNAPENAVQPPSPPTGTPLAAAGDPRTDRRRSPTAAALHLQKCKGDRRVARIRGYRRIQPFFQKDSGRKHHRLPQEEQTCGTHIPSPIRTRRGKTGLRQTGKANGSFPANGNNRQLFRQNRH